MIMIRLHVPLPVLPPSFLHAVLFVIRPLMLLLRNKGGCDEDAGWRVAMGTKYLMGSAPEDAFISIRLIIGVSKTCAAQQERPLLALIML